MNYEIISPETAKKLQDYDKLLKKYNKLKQAYEEILEELKRRDKHEK